MRSATTVEQVHERRADDEEVRWAIEATYEGSLRFEERHLEDPGHHRTR